VSRPHAVISDFGGVLTQPLIGAFVATNSAAGVPLETLGVAMARIGERRGENPLYALERGQTPVEDFLGELARELTADLGREVSLEGFAERYFGHLHPNAEMIELMRGLRARGLRMAILTNNVREWEPLWRTKLPVDEIFELVVDSAFVGMRKPEREIFDLTLERLGLPAEACVFIDDVDVNCNAARALGMRVVHFRSNEQAIPEIEAALTED
jgi:putative hydrolase of the HAD superfamily